MKASFKMSTLLICLRSHYLIVIRSTHPHRDAANRDFTKHTSITTSAMIVGFLSPTSGNAFVCGMNMKRNMNEIRRVMGLCPQHNILYALLTVDEHLIFMKKVEFPREVITLSCGQFISTFSQGMI